MNIIDVESQHYSRKENGDPILTKKNCIVIHDTGGHDETGTISWFLNAESKVSSHYLITKKGIVYRFVPDEYVAWHAGRSLLHGESNVNKFSFGVELVDDNDAEGYPEGQIEALLELCTNLCVAHRIPLNRVVGHNHVATPPGRKVDPGRDFPWYDFLNTLGARVAEKEFYEE